MKFFRNENPSTGFNNFSDALKEVYFTCMIPLKEIPNLFKEIHKENLVKVYFDNLYQRNPVFLPNFPFPHRHLNEGDKLLQVKNREGLFVETDEKVFSKETYIFTKDSGLKINQALPEGSRLYLSIDDIHIWIFYRWLENLITVDLERSFLDEDYRFPKLEDFLTPRFPTSALDEATLVKDYAPNRKAVTNLRKWLNMDGNEHRLVSTHLGNEYFSIHLGLDARILAYYANKEGKKPLCLSSLF